MKAELIKHGEIIEEMKARFVTALTEDKSDLTADYIFAKTSTWVNLRMQEAGVLGVEQSVLHDYLIELFEESLNIPKFVKMVESLRHRNDQIIELVAEQTKATFESVDMITEIESMEGNISFEGINELLSNNGDREIALNTLSKWSSKGYFGKAFTENELCPKTFTNHRTVYFKTEKVLEYLISDKLLHPKYEVLEQVKEWTILKCIVIKGNRLAYYCKDFESDKESILLAEGEE